MRILWICNIMLPAIAEKLHKEYSVREGWLTGVLNRMIESNGNNEVTLGICFPYTENDASFHETFEFTNHSKNAMSVECFGFAENLATPEKYDALLEKRFAQILDQFKPDMVHIFGTEFPHALACAKAFHNPDRLLVGLQGIISKCAESYTADLPDKIINRNTFRDILKKDGISMQQKKFFIRGEFEKETLSLAGNVTGRTEFDKSAVENINKKAKYYFMNETMRPVFYDDKWELAYCRKHRVFFSQADYPLKGFHYLLQALPQILVRYPDAEIVVAGNSIVKNRTIKDKIKISGYGKYLRDYMNEWELNSKIEFLGTLTAEEMKEQYMLCHTLICASSLENSPNSVAEAMLLGVPVIASKTGGIPSMIEDGKDGILFEKGNSSELADAVIKLWSTDELCEQLSLEANKKARETHNPQKNFERLMEIYRQIVSNS